MGDNMTNDVLKEDGTKQGDIDLVFRQIREKSSASLYIMDNGSKTSMDHNSEMFSFSQWQKLRELIHEISELSDSGRSANNRR